MSKPDKKLRKKNHIGPAAGAAMKLIVALALALAPLRTNADGPPAIEAQEGSYGGDFIRNEFGHCSACPGFVQMKI